MSTGRRIILTEAQDTGGWVIEDEETGVVTQGDTREHALEMLDEALALHRGEGEPVTDADLREWGLDPDAVPDEPQAPNVPWFDE